MDVAATLCHAVNYLVLFFEFAEADRTVVLVEGFAFDTAFLFGGWGSTFAGDGASLGCVGEDVLKFLERPFRRC